MANRRRWDPKDVEDVVNSLLRGDSLEEIAARHNRTVRSIAHVTQKRGAGGKRGIGENQKSKIPCLQCKSPFLSEGKHNRRCDNCKRSDEEYFQPEVQHHVAPDQLSDY